MATDPRPARSQSAYSNTPAKLPTLPTIRVTDPQMQRFIEALRVWIDARSGARDIYEKAVTMRDLVQLGLIDGSVLSRGWGLGAAPGPNAVVVETPSTNLVMSNEAFANSIINTRLFQELMRRLDDPARFDALPEEIRSRLLVDIAAEAAQRGADIRRIEEKIQTQEKSTAVAIDEITAAVDNSVAGVRQSVFAYADETRAVAGSVTQIKARIDGVPIPVDQIDTTVYVSLAALQTAKPVGVRGTYYQVDDPASTDNILYQWNGTAYYIAGRGTTASAAATIEEQMTAIADRAQGLEAQYTLKLQAGNKVAGFGLAATDNTTDGATSAFIVSADKFAIVAASDSIPNPLSPPTQRVPFGVDTVNNNIYMTGAVKIDGALLVDGTVEITDSSGNIILSAAENLDLNRVAGGVDFTPSVLTDFPGVPYWWAFGPAQSWTTDDGTLAETSTGVSVVGTTGPVFFFSPPISMPGVKYTRVRARVRRLAGAGWSGVVGYSTPNHAIGSGYTKVLANPGLTSTWQTLEWDMSSLTAGGTDWTTSTITQVVFLLGATASDQFEFSQVDFYAPGVDEFGWMTSSATITKNYGSITLNATGNFPVLASPAGVEAQGASNTKVRMRIKRTAGTGWQGKMYYATGTRDTGQVRAFDENYIQFSSQQPVLNEWRILEWDMDAAATPVGYLNDWSSNTIYQIRFDLGLTSADDFEIDWIGIGRLGPLRINRTNISTYIEGAAIGYLEVGQLKTQNLEVGSVTTLSTGAWAYSAVYNGAATPLVSAYGNVLTFTKSNGDVVVTGQHTVVITASGTVAVVFRVKLQVNVMYTENGTNFNDNIAETWLYVPRLPSMSNYFVLPVATMLRRDEYGPNTYTLNYTLTIDAFDIATATQASVITNVGYAANLQVVETKV